MKKGCDLECLATMTANHFLVDMEPAESGAQEFAAEHCDLVYDTIDFDGVVNDMTKF